MKPAPFGYERPRDLQAALAVLGEAKTSTKIIAGGQSLGPMLNLRLVEPGLIVDITALAELKQAERKVEPLMARVQPDAQVRKLWRQIRQQIQQAGALARR